MELARSRLGRTLAALAGLGVVAWLIHHTGTQVVVAALTKAPLLFPLVVLLEAVLAGGEVWAAFLLYGEKRKDVPLGAALRSSVFCYAVMCVLPFGRAVAEVTRAAMLARYVGGARAAAVATQVQGLTLVGNAIISLACTVAVWRVAGPSWLLAGIALNLVLTSVGGGGLLLATRRSSLGERLGKYFRGGEVWGVEVDTHLRAEVKLRGPIGWMAFARSAQTLQRMVLLAAVGSAWGPLRGLTAQAIALVSSLVGDVIPGQLGVTEAGYALAAQVLQLSQGDAVAIGLLGHLAQVFWIGVGFLSPLTAPTEAKAP